MAPILKKLFKGVWLHPMSFDLLLLLALLAVIDAFVDFRTRAQKEPPEDEDE